MRTIPTSAEMLDVIAGYLRDTVAPMLPAPDSFYVVVAANSLDIVRRELGLGPSADAAANERLQALIGGQGTLADREARLSEMIADGSMPLATPGLLDHLLRTSLDEIAIDQPRYATYRRMRDILGAADPTGSGGAAIAPG